MPTELSSQDIVSIDAKQISACTLKVVGAYGDLTKRLLMPSLHKLEGVGLLYDCTLSDATLFQRTDNAEVGCAAVDPLLKG